MFGRLGALHEELTDTEQRITKAVNEHVDVTAQALTARLNILQAATLILPCIEWLSTNNPIPYEWRETIAEIMQRDIAKGEGVVGLLRARECWTRIDQGGAPLRTENIHTMMRGVTGAGQPITVWSWAGWSSNPAYGNQAAYIEFSETSSDSFYNCVEATEAQLELTRKYILQKMREGGTVTELTLVTASSVGMTGAVQPVPARLQNLKHPPSNAPGLGNGVLVCTSALDDTIAQTLKGTYQQSTALIQYHNPDAADFWYDVPATAVHYGS
ncbi:MAG: hypothetical protein LBJ69_03170 [Holosporales bacterium]|nr:hypothetical protein [Holosporales bacterium]